MKNPGDNCKKRQGWGCVEYQHNRHKTVQFQVKGDVLVRVLQRNRANRKDTSPHHTQTHTYEYIYIHLFINYRNWPTWL